MHKESRMEEERESKDGGSRKEVAGKGEEVEGRIRAKKKRGKRSRKRKKKKRKAR